MKSMFSLVVIVSISFSLGSCGPSDPRVEEKAATSKVAPGERATHNLGGESPDTAAAEEEVILNHDPGENRIGRDPQNMPQRVLTNDADSVTNHR